MSKKETEKNEKKKTYLVSLSDNIKKIEKKRSCCHSFDSANPSFWISIYLDVRQYLIRNLSQYRTDE